MLLSGEKAKGKVKLFWRHKEAVGSSYPPTQARGGPGGDMKYRKSLPFGEEYRVPDAGPPEFLFLDHRVRAQLLLEERGVNVAW